MPAAVPPARSGSRTSGFLRAAAHAGLVALPWGVLWAAAAQWTTPGGDPVPPTIAAAIVGPVCAVVLLVLHRRGVRFDAATLFAGPWQCLAGIFLIYALVMAPRLVFSGAGAGGWARGALTALVVAVVLSVVLQLALRGRAPAPPSSSKGTGRRSGGG